jgi:hypothetical protein
MRRSVGGRSIAIAGLLLGPACASILDLPDPKLDNGVGATGSDGGGPDGTAVGEGGTDGTTGDALTTDGGLDANCNLALAENCGGCGNDCTNGKCTDAGLCIVADMAPGGTDRLYSPEQIDFYGDEIYVTWSTIYESGISRCLKNGCSAPGTQGVQHVMYLDGSSYQYPDSIAIDDAGALFWMSYDGNDAGGVYRTVRDSGATTYLSNGKPVDYSYGMVLHDDKLLFVAADYMPAGGAFVCAKTGQCGNVPVNTLGDNGRSVLSTPYGVVWSMNQQLYLCATPDCSGGKQPLAGGDYPLATDANYLYYATYDNHIRRISLDADAGPEELADPPTDPLTGPGSMVAIGGVVYWSVCGTDPDDGGLTIDGYVNKCQAANCKATLTTVAGGLACPQGLKTDGKSVYWVNHGLAGSSGQPGSIMKAPL